jgi:hypothetical protein
MMEVGRGERDRKRKKGTREDNEKRSRANPLKEEKRPGVEEQRPRKKTQEREEGEENRR